MPLLIGTPSTTKSAELLSCDNEPSPRNVTRIDPPGPADDWSRFSPATLPAMPLSQFPPAVLANSSLETFDTA